MAKKTVSFEKSLQELESLVKQIDSGELELEAALAAFEKGVALIRDCQSALTTAEKKVNLLTEAADGLALTPFDDESDNA